MLLADYGKHVLLPEEKFADFKPPEPIDSRSRSATTTSGSTPARPASPTTCNFDYSGSLTEAILLGNVAYRAGKKLEWDAEKLYAPNCPEAERLSAANTARAGRCEQESGFRS